VKKKFVTAKGKTSRKERGLYFQFSCCLDFSKTTLGNRELFLKNFQLYVFFNVLFHLQVRWLSYRNSVGEYCCGLWGFVFLWKQL